MKPGVFVLFALVVLSAPLSVQAEVTLYGVKFPQKGRKTSGVVSANFDDSHWRSVRNIRDQEHLDRVIRRGQNLNVARDKPLPPIVFYYTPQQISVEKTNLAGSDFLHFHQQAVKAVVDEYRWYWAYSRSSVGKMLAKKYKLTRKNALIVIESDGNLLHLESPVAGPRSISKAFSTIGYKRQMATALESDLPFLKESIEKEDVKTLIKYLRHIEKNKAYVCDRTGERLSKLTSEVNEIGESRIRDAEKLASDGERKKALSQLRKVKRDFKSLPAAKTADKTAKKIRRKRK